MQQIKFEQVGPVLRPDGSPVAGYSTKGILQYDRRAIKAPPWRLTDDEGRLDFTLTPMYDRTTKDKVLFVDSCCHQVFGLFNGSVVLDDGSKLAVKNLTAFAEHAVNNW